MFLPSWYKFYGALRASRYKFDLSGEAMPGYKVGGGHWRSLVPAERRGVGSRVTKLTKARKLSRYTGF
jgi:hypothetical protein